MPPAALLAPIVLPLVAALLIAAFGVTGHNIGRPVAAGGAIAAVLALLVVWLAVRSTQEVNLGTGGLGSAVGMRVDAVGFAFGLMIASPAAVLLALQPRSWPEAALASLGLAAAMGAVEATGVTITALAGGSAATLCAVAPLDAENERPGAAFPLPAAWLLLALAGAALQVQSGTDSYSAVPVASFTGPVFALLALAALVASGLAPWRTRAVSLRATGSRSAMSLGTSMTFPLGFYLLVRAYEMGNGRYPSQAFAVGLSVLGLVIALAAAVRAQAAASRREYLAESIAGFGGFALMMLTLGTPLGLGAALTTLAAATLLSASIALLPDRAGAPSVIAIAAAAGLPPGLAFGSRILGLEATFEAGDFVGLIGAGGAAVWALWMVGAARALGLPTSSDVDRRAGFQRLSAGLSGATLLAGPLLAALQSGFSNPAQADVMANQTGLAATGIQSVVTVSTVMPALALFTPLVLLAATAFLVTGTRFAPRTTRPTLFPIPWTELAERLRKVVAGAAVPDQYRSLVDLRAIEAAAISGRPILWLGAVVALAFAITR